MTDVEKESSSTSKAFLVSVEVYIDLHTSHWEMICEIAYVSIERAHYVGMELRTGGYIRHNYLSNETLARPVALQEDIVFDFWSWGT